MAVTLANVTRNLAVIVPSPQRPIRPAQQQQRVFTSTHTLREHSKH